MTQRTTTSLFGFAAMTAVALAFSPAQAAVVADPVNNDIFLGFRASGNQGATTSYLVNLGQYSQFRDAAVGSTLTLSLGAIGSDLAAAFGANWHTRQDLSWGIFGVSNTANPTVYASREQSIIGSPGVAWSSLDLTARSSTASSIVSVLSGTNGYQGREATENSAFAALQANSTAASSYNRQVATPGTNDFGSLSGWSSIEGDFGSGASGTALDLFRIGSLGVTNPGYFTISDLGVVSFTAVPEPSSLLLGAAGAAALLGVRRRARSEF